MDANVGGQRDVRAMLDKTSSEITDLKVINLSIVVFSLLTLFIVLINSRFHSRIFDRVTDPYPENGRQIEPEGYPLEGAETDTETRIQQVNRELTVSNLRLLQTNETMLRIKSELEAIAEQYPDTRVPVKRLIREFSLNIQQNKEWESFQHYYDEALGGFFDQLVQVCPQITGHEKRLAALVKLDLPNDQIASILGIAPASVKVLKHRLKKKLNIPENISIANYLAGFEQSQSHAPETKLMDQT